MAERAVATAVVAVLVSVMAAFFAHTLTGIIG